MSTTTYVSREKKKREKNVSFQASKSRLDNWILTIYMYLSMDK